MKNFFDDEFASEEAKGTNPLSSYLSDLVDIKESLSSDPVIGRAFASTLKQKAGVDVETPKEAPSLFERFFKREKEPDAYGGITPYAVFPERKSNVAPVSPDPVWEMEEALRAEAARRIENPTTFGYFSNHDFNRDADADAARRAEEMKAKAEAEQKLQAAFDAGERQRREKSGMGLYIPESVDMASSGTLPDEEAVRRVLANAVAEVVEKDAELPPDRSLLEKMAEPQWQYEMERNIARIKEAEAIKAKGETESPSVVGKGEATRSYAGPDDLIDLSGVDLDSAHFGKAIRNIIPMYADSMSKSTIVSAFEKEQARQAKGAENIFKETDAYLGTRRPTEEDIARIKSEPAVPFSLEGGRQSGLTDAEAAMLMQADAAERKGDFEKAKRLRETVAKHVVDIAERADALAKWSEENRVQYERPAGYWHNAVLNTIESSGHTIGSAIRSGAAWALGGIVGVLLMSPLNTGMEAESEAGQALHRLIEKGEKSPEEMRKAVEAARGRNVALLSVTNPLGDWLLFGTGKIASSVAKAIPGKTILAKTMREAVQRIFPFVASGAPEAVEEMGQTYITSLATGDPLKENELRDSAVQGFLGRFIYAGVGKAARSVVNFTKESLSKGKSSAVTESFLAGVVLSQRGKSFMENAEAVAKFNKVDGVDKLEIALMPEGLQRDYFLLQRAQELIEEGKYTEATDLMTGKIRGEDADTLIFTPKALAFQALSETKVRLDKEKAAEYEYGVLDVADAFMEEKDYDGALRVLNAYNGKSHDTPASAVEEAKSEEVKAAPVEAEIVEETPVRDAEVVDEPGTPVSNERKDPLQESLDGFGNEFDRLVGELGKIDKDLADAAVLEMERRKKETAAKNPVIQSSTRVEITEPGKKPVVIEGENWKDALDKASAVEAEVISSTPVSSTPVASAPVAPPVETPAPAPASWWQDVEIVDAERALVKALVKKDLISAGTSEEVADAQSAVMAQGVVASARREANPDLSPLAWYEKFGPSIGMGKAPAAKAPAVKEEVAPVSVEVAPTQEAVPPVVEAPAPKGSLVDNGAHSFVDVASIAPVGDRASFDQDKIEAMADEMLRVGVLPEPLLVRRTGGDTFEVVGDGLRYWAAVRAKEKNPRLGEMTSALIVDGDAAAFEKQREMLGGKNVVAPDGFIIDERGQGLVDVKAITPRTKRDAFNPMLVDMLADSILELGGLVRPLAVKRTGAESFETVGDDLAYWAAVRAKEKSPRFEMVNSFIYTPSQARDNAPVSVESVSEEQIPSIDESAQQEAVVAPSPLLDRILAEPTINKRLEIIDGATKEELVSALASRGKEFKPNAGTGMLRSHLKRAVALEGMKAADVQKFAKQNGLNVGKMKKGDVSNAVLDMVAPRRSEDVDANPFGVKAIVVDPRRGTGLEAVVEATTPELRKGNINGKRIMLREDVLALQFEPGEVVLTSTGRETTPYPKMDVSTNGKRINSLKRFDQWLLSNAITEAESRGDNMNARIFQGDVDRVGKLPSATRDMAESYLFDSAFVFERQRPLLKPMVEAMETSVDASVKMDTQDGVESEQSESAKEAWRVRRDDWVDGRYRSPGMHRYAVQQALEKGENVPAEVLSDYPEFMTSKIQIPELIDKGVESSNEEAIANDGAGDDAGNAGLLAEGVSEGVQNDAEGRRDAAGDGVRGPDADGDGRAEAGESESDGRDGVVGVETPVLHDAAAGGAGTDSQGLGTGSDNRGVGDSAMEVGDASEGSLPGDGSGPAQEVAAILSETESGRGASGRGVIQAKDRKKTSDGTVVEIAGENPGNFVIGPDFALGEGTDAAKIQRNVDALKVLKRVKDENRFPTREEQAVMARYVGWGGLKNVFDPARAESNDMFGKAQRALRELLTTEEYNDAAASIQNAHYTAKGVVEAMWRLARHFGFKGGRVLEPTVGVGNFLGLQPEDMAAASEWHASELDTVSGEIAAMLYPDAHVLASTGFEDAAFADGAFDLAIGNPPFGDMPIIRGLKKNLHGMKIHNYIIAKSGDHLRPGGVMMMVVTHRFLDTENAEARSHLAKQFKFLGAVRLPNDAFKKNAGTEVVTDIIMLQKLRPGEGSDMNAAWLDVNGSIDVDGSAVRVNKYYEEHPSHILGRSATDGKMYARGAGNEYTVHSDGRDVAKAIDDLIATDFANLSGVMTPTNADLNLGAAMLERSSLAIGSLLLDNNGKILRRDMDDSAGNAVIEEITAETLWKDQAKEWEALIDVLTDIRDRDVKGDVYDLIEPYAAVAYKAKGGEKGDATQADKAVYAIVNAAKEGDFEWRFDDEMKEIDAAYRRRQLGEPGLARLKGMLDLRNRVLSLNAAERADAPNIEALRKELNKAYDTFVKKFGYVNSANNFKLLEGDIGPEVGLESSYSKGMSKAVAKKAGFDDAVPDKATKADILSKRVNYPDSEIESADSSEDALKISLSQRGRVDAPYMAQLTGKPIEDVLRELTAGETPFLFLNSETNEYEHADEFLSGNVKKKLRQAVAAGDERAAEALRKVQPEPKSAERITPSIRSAWIPESVFVEFLTALGVQGARVNILPSVGLISAQGRGESVRDLGITYSTPHRTLVDLFNSAASGKSITITHRVGEQTVVDKAATEQVNALAKKMGEDFKMWAYSSEERKQVIVDAFNEKMNTHVDRKYDGVAYLNPVGVTPSLKLRNVQKNAAWRMIQSKTMLHDHVVGLGKTFSNIVGVMERKRLGLSKKPLVVVPNHLVTQWAADFYKVYPNAKILAATPADFSKKNRRRLFARMATGDFDAIIIGHSSFQFIPAAEADTALVVQEQIDQLRDAIEQARGTGEGETKGDKRTLAMIQKKLQSYENRLVKMNEKRAEKADKMGNEEHGIDFESLGIDYLVVDEAHEFKNLEYNTMSDRVIGMNSPDGSQKAFDLYVKIRGMLERGGAVSFATGTPVSNSLVEIYTMMKYLAHDELRDRGQLFYDAWAGAYVETEMRAEYTPAQTLVMRNVLSGLSNLSGLQQIYKQFADTVTMEQLKSLYREEVEERNRLLGQNERTEFPVPKVKDGGRRLLTLPATPVQAEVNEWLVARLEAIRTGGKEYRSRDNVLNVMTDARKAALDIRILDPRMPREETGKVVTASKEIKRIYDKWDDVRGAQFVFCDLSTPTKYAAANAKKLLRDAMKIVFGDKGIPAFIKEAGKGGFEATWKAALETVNEKFESGDVSDAIKDEFYEFLEENDDAEAVMITADVGFSVYDDLKAMLRESGIPESEIAFIHDYNTPEQKKELFNKVNRGIIRVLIGSSAKMGAGMNAQERAVALHHLDAPWRPSDMEQREGRIIRQENSLYAANPDGFEVEIIAYSAQASNDAVMWQILERKAKAIEQFRSGGDVDSIVEGSSDADQYADFMASSTGNPVYKQELEARKVLSDAETSVVGRLTARSNAENFLAMYARNQKELLQKIKDLGEIDASHEDFAKGKELLDGLDDEYRTARAKYEVKRDEVEKAIAKWNDTPKESRGKKPEMPNAPKIVTVLRDEVVDALPYARRVKEAMDQFFSTTQPQTVSMGDGVTIKLSVKLDVGVPQWWADVYVGEDKVSSVVKSVIDPRNSPEFMKSFDPRIILDSARRAASRAKFDLSKLEERKTESERIMETTVSLEERANAEAVWKWYKLRVSLAEAETAAARGDKENRFITADKRPLRQRKGGQREESRTIEINGEEYQTSGIWGTQSTYADVGAIHDAVRVSDNLPVILSSDEKRGFYVVMEQPASLREGAEETLYQMGDADADYLAAVEAGDMETAQRMVDEAAERSGLPILDDSAATAYKIRRAAPPKKTIKAYKLFNVKKSQPGEIFPLYVGSTNPLPKGVWLDAEAGPEANPSKTGKPQVKSALGPLAYRPGWHAGDLPLATHIGVKGADGKIYARASDEVWAEVEVAADIDYQPEADANGRTKSGRISAALADIKHMPVDGMYRYKTNSNMTGNWIISGSMKINRILSEAEVNAILEESGAKSMPWEGGPLNLEEKGLTSEPAKNVSKLLDPVTYDDSGKIIPLSKRFDAGKDDVRYQRRLTPKSGSYRDNLKKDAAAFAVAVDDTVSGKGEPDSYVNVMTTPLVLSLVGADVLPVQMRRQKLLDVMNKHGLSSEVLKKIPAALADPIMVFKSDLKAKGESLVVMLDLTDDDGATIIAALHLDVVPGRNMYAMNRLASVYGKKDAVENRDAWFVEQMGKGNAKYINKKKSSQWFGRASFFFTGGANLESFITQSVATEADLVKLRNAYPGYYQGEGAEAKGSITFRRGTDARPEIRLFENADASTFMHEAMHFFVDDLLRQMNTGKPSDETRALYRQLNNVANVTRDKNKNLILAEKEHEKLAVGFEAYLERGVAPKGAKGLQGVFEKFKQWLKELFSFARSNNVEMSDALVSLYDTMLTTPEERAAAENELAESVNVEEIAETIEAAEVEADVNEGVETIEAEVVAEDETVDFASTEGEKELAGQPRAWEAPRPSMNPKARALGLSKIRDLVKRIVPWRFGNTEDRTGVYSEREKLIKTKDDYDFPTAMHEVGHHLMNELKLNTGLPKGTLKELESLGRQTARPGAAQDVVLAEGVAQFVQYYIINKAAAKAAAPIFFVEFESRLDGADAKLVEDFGDLRDAVSAFYESMPERRVLAHVRSAGEKRPYSKTLVSSRLKRAIFRTYEGLVDDKHSWNVLTEWIKKTPEGKEEMKNNGGFLPDRLDFYAQVSTLAGYMKQADKDVEGMMGLVGKLTKREYDQLTAYAVSLQSIEYYDNDMNPGTGPRSDHEAVVANTPQHIKDVLKGVQDIYNNMVKETLLDTGVISQEGFDAMRTKWENYVPFMRDLDEEGFIDWLTKGAPKNGANLRSYVDVRNPFMKRYGVAEHERTEIFDPFEVMIHNAVVFHGIKSRNDFAKLVVDAANSLDGFGWLASKSEAMSKADMKEHAVFYVWRDGQKEYYSTDPELYVLLKGMYDSGSKAGNPFIRGALSWMQFAADVFKMGTTRYNPAFMLLNFLRDAQGTAIQSEGWAMPFVATIKGLMLQLSNDPKHKKLIEDAINDGVFYSAITSLPKGTSIEAIAKELRRQRALASSTGIARTLRNLMETPRSVGGWIGRANEMIEMAPKLYEYEYLRRTKPKMGGKRAAMKARSVNIDFGRAGTWGRGFNSVTAFFNAGVQGLDKVREVSKQRPMQTFAKVMLYQVLPSIMMRLAILSNPDDEEKYQRIAPGMRDTHFFIPVQNETLGMNVWTRLPKADNWWIISAVFERMITEAAKKDPEAWRGFADSVVNLLPPYVPTMIAPIIQVWRGKDSFTDGPIVSKRYEHRPDELQFHTGTSETAKLLGRVTKTSPIMLEFMYDKHVGEVGAQVLSLAEWTFDMVGTGMGLVDEKTKMEAGKASDLPFFKRFFYDTTRTGEPLNRFYSYHDQLLDDKKRADAAGTIFEDERLLKAFNKTRAKFTEINREKDDIRLDPDLSRKDKRELIDMLENRAAEYAKAAMAVYYEEKGIK